MLRLMTISSWYRLFRAKACASVRGNPVHISEGGAGMCEKPFTRKSQCLMTHDLYFLVTFKTLVRICHVMVIPESITRERYSSHELLLLFISFRQCCFLLKSCYQQCTDGKHGLTLFPDFQWNVLKLWYNNRIAHLWVNLVNKQSLKSHSMDQPAVITT